MNFLKDLKNTYPWLLKHMGGIFQVQLKSVKDLEELATLDPKLWVALSCPVNDLEIDRGRKPNRFLEASIRIAPVGLAR